MDKLDLNTNEFHDKIQYVYSATSLIKENENAKYVHDIDGHWLDQEVKKACEASVYE